MTTQTPTPNKSKPIFFFALSILLALGGVAGFAFLLAGDHGLYMLILAPVILAVYEIPAAFFFRLYKRSLPDREEEEDGSAGAGPGPDLS